MGTLRLTGGEFRGRMIQCPANLRTRPTQARLRQALFNSLQTIIEGARVLDLFSGSGALGYEAISRGAGRVTFVEADRAAAKLVDRNGADLRVADRIVVINDRIEDSVHGAIARVRREAPFDLVLADPPYAENWETKLLNELPWDELLAPGGRFCLEWGRLKSAEYREGELPERVPFLVKIREKAYGDSVLTTYERADS